MESKRIEILTKAKEAVCGELVISQVKNEENGTASYFTEIIMDTMEFAESKSKRESLVDNLWHA